MHCIDQDYRRLREVLDAAPRAHDRLRDRCARSYRDILRRMNDRFCTLLDAEGTWPAGALPAQEAFWTDVMAAQRTGQRIAVMFVDALRYELGQELWQALEYESAGDQRQLTARLAAIPTVTPIGMAALLPGGDRRQVAYSNAWEVTIKNSGNLKDKGARRKWLERHLQDVAFYNLEELLNTPADRIPETTVYIVFDTTLDAVGETASQLAWNTFSSLLQSVKRGVHKLLELGVSQVHLVTDHGLLLLDEVGEHDAHLEGVVLFRLGGERPARGQRDQGAEQHEDCDHSSLESHAFLQRSTNHLRCDPRRLDTARPPK